MSDASRKKQWFLKIKSGTIFGPVSIEGLVNWAEQGRVQAGNSVSTDRSSWQPAESLPELAMNWYLEDSRGELLGPFNKSAAQKIIDEKHVAEDTTIVSSENADLSRVRQPQSIQAAPVVGSDQQELKLGCDEEHPSQPDQQSLDLLQAELEELRTRLKKQEESSQKLLKSATKENKVNSKKISEAHQEIENLKKQLEAEQSNTEKLKARIVDLVGQLAENAAEDQSSEELRADRDKLSSSLREVRGNYSELLEYSNERDKTYEAKLDDLNAKYLDLENLYTQSIAQNTESDATKGKDFQKINKRYKEQEILLAGVLEDDRKTIESILASEHQTFITLREQSLERQKLLQARLNTLVKLQGGDTRDAFEREAQAREERNAIKRQTEEISNLQEELDGLKRSSAIREQQLSDRVRILEIEGDRLRAVAADAELMTSEKIRLEEKLEENEMMLAQERQERQIEQAELLQAQQALLDQLESQRRKTDSLDLTDNEKPAENATKNKSAFKVTPWMQLKR